MRKIYLCFIFAISIISTNCTREVSGTSKLRFETSQAQPRTKTGALAVGVLTHLVINVHVPEGPPRVFEFDSDCRCPEDIDIPLPSQIELEVPSDGEALIQVLSVFEDETTEDLSFHYGDSTTNLAPGDVNVNISTTQISSGSGREGRVVGRFLESGAGAGAGPTEVLIAKIQPPGNKPEMSLFKREVFGGWVNLFLIDGVDFTFAKPDGTVVFSDLGFNSPELAPSQRVAHIKVPKRFTPGGGNDPIRDNDAQEMIMGFFGPGADATRAVCFDATDNKTISGAFLDATASTTPLKWFGTTPTPAHAHRAAGGTNTGAFATCGSASEAFNHVMIFDDTLLKDHIEGTGGFEGPFRSVGTSGFEYVTKTESGGNVTLTWDYLPGVFEGANSMDGVTIFQAETTAISEALVFDDEGMHCGELQDFGYRSVGDRLGATNETITFADLGFKPASDKVPQYVVCPFTDKLPGGRFYFSSAAEVRDFGGGPGGSSFKLVFETSGGGALTNTANADTSECINIDLKTQDSFGSPLGVDATYNINLTTSNDDNASFGQFFSGSGCAGGAVTQVTFNSGEDTKPISFKASSNDYHRLEANGSSGPFDSGRHEIGYTTSGGPTKLEARIAAIFSGSTFRMVQNQCYIVEVRSQNSSNKPVAYGATADLQLNPNGLTAEFFNSIDCSGGNQANIDFPDSEQVHFVSIKITSTGSDDIVFSDGSAILSSRGVDVGTSAITGFQISDSNVEFTPGQCHNLQIHPVNSFGAAVNVSSDLDLRVTSTSGTALHEDGGCNDSSNSQQDITIFSGEDSAFVFAKPTVNEFEIVVDVTDVPGGGSTTTTDLLAVPRNDAAHPFQHSKVVGALFTNATTLSGTLTASGNHQSPNVFSDLDINSNLAASGASAIFISAHEVTFSGSSILSANGANGFDGTSSGIGGAGGAGASGGGGGGVSNTSGNGGNGGSTTAGSAGIGVGTPGAGGAVTGDYLTGGTFSFGSGGAGGVGGFTGGGSGGTSNPGAGGGGGGGAGENSFEAGGGGGAGGGLVVVVANVISGTGSFKANGGDGGNAETAGAGAGAGGGGGVIYIAAREYNVGGGLGCEVSGGSGSPGVGVAGTDGGVGNIQLFKINADNTLTSKGSDCTQQWTAD